MKLIIGLIVVLCVVVEDNSVLSATTFRRRPVFRDETSTSAAVVTSEIVESPTVRRRASRLSLPSNATSIRSDISESFSCEGRAYGYYADVENDCQIFHVCLPVTYPDGKGQQFRWSFICPEDTTFNQEAFTCVRTDDMPFSCADSERFYELNRYLGLRDEVSEDIGSNALDASDAYGSQLRISDRRQSLRTTTTPAPTTTTSTTTTVRPSPTQRREASRVPIFRRTSTKILQRTTLPATTTVTETAAATQENTMPTDRTHAFDSLFETTELPSSASPIETTLVDLADTEATTVARIVPDLIEVGGNSENSDDPTEAKITDEVIQNIKQLQNILPMNAKTQSSAPLSTPISNTSQTIEDQRRKRFLFAADAIENRRRLFNRLNSNTN